MHRSAASVLGLCLALFVGCGGGGGSTGTGTGGSSTTCSGGMTACSGACADLMTDATNCGACGMACGAGEACTGGKCALSCTPTQTACPAASPTACVDTKTDPGNCGGCGMACPAGQVCTGGTCGVTCPTAKPDACGAGSAAFCTDLTTDAQNCGQCGMACPAGQVCANKACACPSTLTSCSGICVDTKADSMNCGGCGMACPSGQLCAAGQCVSTCPPGTPTVCGTGATAYCADTTADPNNCSACGMACPGGQQCTSSACACPAGKPDACGSGATATCTDLQTDAGHCGTCGTTCGAMEVCTSGKCVSTCPPGTPTPCGSGATAYCADTTSDPGNCGACGTACASGAACTASACACPSGEAACGAGASTPGTCVLSEQCLAGKLPTDCAQLHLLAPAVVSGTYTIDPDGAAGPVAPFAVYCDMTSDGGGWTLALKADGAEATASRFAYGSSLWTTTDPTDPSYVFQTSSADLSRRSAKLMSFNTVPYTQIRLGMSDKVGSQGFVQFSLPGASAYGAGAGGAPLQTSLQATFASGTFIPAGVTPTRAEWLGLVSSPNLQASCNQGGINNGLATSARTRLGFLGNQETDCTSPDSYIGLGNDDAAPCSGTTAYVGNAASCNGTGGTGTDGTTPAFAWLFVRNTDFRTVVPAQPSCAAHLAAGYTIPGIYPIAYGGNTSAVYCDMTHAGGGWTMVYKFTSGLPSATDAAAVWAQTAATNESDPTQLDVMSTLAAPTGPYVGRIVTNDWNSAFPVAKARVVAYQGEEEAASIAFNAPAAATTTSWFAAANVASSTWTDVTPSGTYNFFSIQGDYNAPTSGGRRFFVNANYGGCAVDTGWLAVTYAGTEGCSWETKYGSPSTVLYANASTKQDWTSGAVGVATALVVYVQ